MQKRTPSKILRISSGLLLLVFLLNACIPFQIPGTAAPEEKEAKPQSTINQADYAEIIFQVIVPEDANKSPVYLDILDETTGLALRPTRYSMEEQNSTMYITKIPLRMGSVIKYRYRKDGNPPAVELNNLSQVVRYRQYVVSGPSETVDQVIAWNDTPNPAPTAYGRVEGVAKDAQTGAPVPNMLVTVAGQQVLSAPDGTFLFEGVQPGTHLIVAQHINGEYSTFQQGATVAINATTPAILAVEAKKLVNVTFHATVPAGSISGLPIRVIGSTFNLGNTFSDLQGGMSAIASRAPLMQVQEDGTYKLTMQLPAGAYIEYKYTLGDGYWNAEQSASGAPYSRFIIVPGEDITIDDEIAAWGAEESNNAITFKVIAPDTTPATDTVSLQLNAFGWSAPIPMWPLGNNQWIYILNGPQQMLQYLQQYRYCRNDNCDSGVEADSSGVPSTGRSIPVQPLAEPIQDTIAAWSAMYNTEAATTVPEIEIKSRPEGFITGVELVKEYSPFSQAYFGPALKSIKDLNAGWLVLSPVQTMTEVGNPLFHAIPGQHIAPLELAQIASWTAAKQMKVMVFPKIELQKPAEEFWIDENREPVWWSVAFERYEKYLLAQADLARMVNASALIIGDPAVSVMMNGGTLPDGSRPEIPFDVNSWWNNLVTNLRARYEGKIYLAIDPTTTVDPSAELIAATEGVYALYAPSVSTDGTEPSEIIAAVDKEIEELLLPLHAEGKEFIIAFQYPSVYSNQAATPANLDHQVTVYNAILTAVNSKDWVSGIVSRGFEPGLITKLDNASVFGKPAANALWYWFPRLLGLQ